MALRDVVKRIQMVALVALLVLCGGLFAPREVQAASLPTFQQAWASCQAVVANYPALNLHCLAQGTTICGVGAYTASGGQYGNAFGYDCSTMGPSTACTSLPPIQNSTYPGKFTNGQTFPQNTKDPYTGATVTCTAHVTVHGGAVLSQWGKWQTNVTITYDPNPAGSVSPSPGVVKNPDGSTPNPAPPDLSNPAVTSPGTQSCMSSSCYNFPNDTYSASSGTGSLGVSGNTARSTGGCVTSGDSAICAGSAPPAPPSTTIPDPVVSHTGSDQYTQADPNTGANQNIVVNTYTNPGGQATTSGQKSGDSGPASSSSTGGKGNGDGTTSSGGGDCNTPPLVNGSGGMSAIAFQTWKTRCDIESQGGNKLGTGTVNSLGDLYTPSTDTTQSVVGAFQSTVMQTPIAGAASNFFSVGSVGGSCPTWTLAATDWNAEQTFDFYCRPEADEALDMARIVLLIVCAYVAFQIAMGDS